MSPIRWISPAEAPDAFPPADEALEEPNGLVAAGGDLSPERLLLAYPRGIFPWYEAGQPILWWSPDPRAVLWPSRLRVSRSLGKIVTQRRFGLSSDAAFDEVLEGCAAPRSSASGTWITAQMASAYSELHRLGWAHSFEAWQDGRLVGGLYGVAIGRVFFGESMFARISNASKAAFVTAVRYLEQRGYALIDCQIASAHMSSLGATALRRRLFLDYLRDFCGAEVRPGGWREDFAEWIAAARR
jgi:leucyl/phenylalanyl-tRNA--protein transferase